MNTNSLAKISQQPLHFLRRLKKVNLPPPILSAFYRGTIESILTNCITLRMSTITIVKLFFEADGLWAEGDGVVVGGGCSWADGLGAEALYTVRHITLSHSSDVEVLRVLQQPPPLGG
eukprot:superscaffoldBa00000332_g3861